MSELEDRLLSSVTHLRRYGLLTNASRQTMEDRLRIAVEYVLRERVTSSEKLKLKLFATYQAVCNSFDLIEKNHNSKTGDAVEHNDITDALLSVPLKDRQALILLAMEDFSMDEAAYILDCPANDVEARNLRAKGAIIDYLRA